VAVEGRAPDAELRSDLRHREFAGVAQRARRGELLG
jgi:hypothetical protein